ncbi:unnamed protein product [Oncorhynchus mykiss]|uniref:Discs, large (Drosophila) homolog-associated protein 5 n=1 Tax=Oncorhynchus mykiss TaxID=8022 RepID=A0A060X1Y6_ONCMY|nr:unnamed protein product [Oncorhynchus mykiss]
MVQNSPNLLWEAHAAVEERMKKLACYKEKKELVKEKEKRAREKKGVFKVGLYRPEAQPLVPLPQAPAATIKARVRGHSLRLTQYTADMSIDVISIAFPPNQATTPVVQPQSTRVTRSTMRQRAPKVTFSLPIVRAPSTSSANRPRVSVAPVAKDKPAPASKTRSIAKQSAAPPVGRGRNTRGEHWQLTSQPCPEPVSAQADCIPPSARTLSSFAPQGFVFQAPAALSSFNPKPLTPALQTPFSNPALCMYSTFFILSSVSVLHLVPLWPSDILVPKMELSVLSPAKSPAHSPPRPSPTLAPRCLPSPKEPEHDVPYFRSVVVSETERLTEFCQQWEPRVDDASVPEEMRDRMRTAVGQARLLMKESSLAWWMTELGRGKKITTCTDLQGFWDMVYYQVEDVNKMFGALKEVESKGWQEESKPPPRQRKVVKKLPSALVAKPTSGAVTKSRLAAIKANSRLQRQRRPQCQAVLWTTLLQLLRTPRRRPRPQNHWWWCSRWRVLPNSQVRLVPPPFFPQASPQLLCTHLPSPPLHPYHYLLHPHPCSPHPHHCLLHPHLFHPHPCLLHPHHCLLHPHPCLLTPAYLSTPRPPPKVAPPESLSASQQSKKLWTPIPSNQPELASMQNVTPDQPEPESMQEDVACDQSEVVSEPVCPEEHSESSNLPTPSPCLVPPSSPPAVQVSLSSVTPDTSITEVSGLPGLDFERNLQPAVRCSLSPREPAVAEMLSPMVIDVEMEKSVGSV